MKVPIEWLKEYVAVRRSPASLAERLTMAGLEVTGMTSVEGTAVLDIEVTPNRADCLSIIGIAREVAAMTSQRLKLPGAQGSRLKAQGKSPRASSLPGPPPRPVPGHSRGGLARAGAGQPRARLVIRIEDPKGCQRYIGRLIEGVTIGPSPEWMQRRLIACGLRPINNVVDVTNYVLLEYGQPLHAFDFDRLAGGTIRVRRARAQESITTLDGVRRTLSPEMLVIADAQRPVAVAGVMGGAGSEVTPQTKRVLLESALFDPVTIRRTARALGLTSESSYRFERGVDPVGVEAASGRAAARLQELARGTVSTVVDGGARPPTRTVIALDTARASRWLGLPIAAPSVRRSLARLGCQASGTGRATRVVVPSFRRDLTQAVDLYEELARLAGYERLPERLPSVPMAARGTASPYDRAYALRALCAGLGLTETMTWSLVSEAALARLGIGPAEAARLTNPLSRDHALLRPSLLVGLLQTVRHNLAQGATGVRVFEVGHVVARGVEELRVGMALSGVWLRDWRTHEPCDVVRLLGLVQALAGRLGLGTVRMAPIRLPWAEDGAVLAINERSLGVAGAVSRAVLEAHDLEPGVWLADLSAAALLEEIPARRTVREPSAFPPVRRDLSVLVSEGTSFAAMDRAMHEAGGALANRIELVDRYTGRQVPPGQASLTFSIEYRHTSRTLTAAEADAAHQRIVQAIVERFGAVLR